jgi:hypothetical protein
MISTCLSKYFKGKIQIFTILLLILPCINAASQDTINVLFYPDSKGYKIPSDFAGLSFEKDNLNSFHFVPSRDTLIRLFQTLGIKSVRIGGNSVDRDTFSANTNSTHFTKAELDSFYLFIEKTGSKVLHGLNFGGDFNPSLASSEVSYIMSKYSSNIWGLEVGNEPDLYHSNGLRPSTYNISSYEAQYMTYYDTIKHNSPSAVFTGPVAATNYTTFTLPFCRNMHGKFSMLTQHYYVAKAYSLNTHKQIINLLKASNLNSIVSEVNALVQCADSVPVPFRMAECNSLYDGGQWSVSDAFVSSLWALDYMYALASKGCAGVNFHGGMGGAYTPLAYTNNLYSARPISYGIMAFQVGSHGWIIPSVVTNNIINLNIYSTVDSANTVYATIVNKDTLQNAFMQIEAGSGSYPYASYITLNADSLADTLNVKLGGQQVNAYGTCLPYNWQTLNVSAGKTQLLVPAGSAAIIRFSANPSDIATQIASENDYTLFPNPAKDEIKVIDNLSTAVGIDIYNLIGEKVCTLPIADNRLPITINISNLSKGIYLLEVINNDGLVHAIRFIRE